MARDRRFAVWASALGIGMAVAAGGALAKIDAAKTVADRQAGYKQLGGAFKSINDELKSGAPDMAVIKTQARKMEALGARVGTWFPRGTGPSKDYKTGAKAEIWTDAKGFAAAAAKLKTATAALAAAAERGDIDAVKTEVRSAGAACKGCHDEYRVKPS